MGGGGGGGGMQQMMQQQQAQAMQQQQMGGGMMQQPQGMQAPQQQQQPPPGNVDVNQVIAQMHGQVVSPQQGGPQPQNQPERPRFVPGSAAEAFAIIADRAVRQEFRTDRDRAAWSMIADVFSTAAALVAHYDPRGAALLDDARCALRVLATARGKQQPDPTYAVMLSMLDSTVATSATTAPQAARALSLWMLVAFRMNATVDGFDEWQPTTLPDGRLMLENQRTHVVELRTREQTAQRAANMQNMQRIRRMFLEEAFELTQELTAMMADPAPQMTAAAMPRGSDAAEWQRR
jgi:hypothetical protein